MQNMVGDVPNAVKKVDSILSTRCTLNVSLMKLTNCHVCEDRPIDYMRLTRSSSPDEIANVNFFTTTSCTYYKIQNLLSNEAEVYKHFYRDKIRLAVKFKNNNEKVMLVCDSLCIRHSF